MPEELSVASGIGTFVDGEVWIDSVPSLGSSCGGGGCVVLEMQDAILEASFDRDGLPASQLPSPKEADGGAASVGAMVGTEVIVFEGSDAGSSAGTGMLVGDVEVVSGSGSWVAGSDRTSAEPEVSVVI